mgnify:CR=1 FL=1
MPAATFEVHHVACRHQSLVAANGDLDEIGRPDTVEHQRSILTCAKQLWKSKAADDESAKKSTLVQIKKLLKDGGFEKNKWIAVLGHAESEMAGGEQPPGNSENRQQEVLAIITDRKNALGNLVGNNDDDAAAGE